MANKTTNVSGKEYTQLAGLDIGNGVVKGAVLSNLGGETDIDIQSVAIRKKAKIGEIRHEMTEADSIIADIFNHLDATFESPCIEEQGRYVIGNSAMISGKSQIIFEIGENARKSEQDLSPILTLSCIAGKALQDAWASQHKLLDRIDVHVLVAAMALPIQEYRTSREKYASQYVNAMHKVTIHTFHQDVVVNIIFDNVQVFAEGGAATFAIRRGGEEMVKDLIKDANVSSGQNITLDAGTVAGIKAIMGIDIGEGTTNFTFYDEAGHFSAEASDSIQNGYGIVLDDSLEDLHKAGHNFNSRKDLQTFLNSEETRRARPNELKAVQDIVDDAIDAFSLEIVSKFRDQIKKHSAHINAIYVYGGGATTMKHCLFPALVKKLRQANGGIDAQPILYFSNPQARYLNRDGLFLAAEKVLERDGKTL